LGAVAQIAVNYKLKSAMRYHCDIVITVPLFKSIHLAEGDSKLEYGYGAEFLSVTRRSLACSVNTVFSIQVESLLAQFIHYIEVSRDISIDITFDCSKFMPVRAALWYLEVFSVELPFIYTVAV
jgi:hypothetical protein